MNDTLLRRLYGGEVYPAEDLVHFITPQDRERDRTIEKEKEHILTMLSLDGSKRFQDLENLWRDSSNEYAFQNFAQGFRLGVTLMMETLITKTTE